MRGGIPEPIRSSAPGTTTTHWVGPQRLRIASITAHGTRVINLSPTATVWVSSDSTIAAGVGTPIAPMTSIVIGIPGDIWAILGLDQASIDAGTAQLQLTTEVLDWQPDPIAVGVAVATQLVQTGVGLNYTWDTLYQGPGAATTPVLDVRKYTHLIVVVPPFGADSDLYSISTQFGETPGLLNTGKDAVWGCVAYANQMHRIISCQGSYAQITFSKPTWGHRIYGTNRPLGPSHSLWPEGDYLYYNTSVYAVNAANAFYLPPLGGYAEVAVISTLSPRPASTALRVGLQYYTQYGWVAINELAEVNPAPSVNNTIKAGRVKVPVNVPSRISVTNQATVAGNISISIAAERIPTSL